MKTIRILLLAISLATFTSIILPGGDSSTKFGQYDFGGRPSQTICISVFGEPNYPFQFTLWSKWSHRMFQGSYVPGVGYYFIELNKE